MPETETVVVETAAETVPDRYERLATLWGVSLEEAKQRDDQQRADIAAAREKRKARQEAQKAEQTEQKKALASSQRKAASPAKSAVVGLPKAKAKPDGEAT